MATLVPRQTSVVYGVIWEISDIALTGLDICMGMPGIYDRFGSFARSPAGELISSEYYGARNNRTLGKAEPDYLRPILDAARRWGFPEPYLEEIASWTRSESRTITGKQGRR